MPRKTKSKKITKPEYLNSCNFTRPLRNTITNNVNTSVNNIITVLDKIQEILDNQDQSQFGYYANSSLTRCFSEEFLQKANRLTTTKSYSQATVQCDCGIYDYRDINNLGIDVKQYFESIPQRLGGISRPIFDEQGQPKLDELGQPIDDGPSLLDLNPNIKEYFTERTQNAEEIWSNGRYASCGKRKEVGNKGYKHTPLCGSKSGSKWDVYKSNYEEGYCMICGYGLNLDSKNNITYNSDHLIPLNKAIILGVINSSCNYVPIHDFCNGLKSEFIPIKDFWTKNKNKEIVQDGKKWSLVNKPTEKSITKYDTGIEWEFNSRSDFLKNRLILLSIESIMMNFGIFSIGGGRNNSDQNVIISKENFEIVLQKRIFNLCHKLIISYNILGNLSNLYMSASANFVGKASSQELYLSFLESIPDKDLIEQHDKDKEENTHKNVTAFIQKKLTTVLEKSNKELIERNNILKEKFNKKEIVLNNKITELNSKITILRSDNEANKKIIESLTTPDPGQIALLNSLKEQCMQLLKRKLNDEVKQSVQKIHDILKKDGEMIKVVDLVLFMKELFNLYEGMLDKYEYIVEKLKEKVTEGQDEIKFFKETMIRLTKQLEKKEIDIKKLTETNIYLKENKKKFFMEDNGNFESFCAEINTTRTETLLEIGKQIKDKLSFLDTQYSEVSSEEQTKFKTIIEEISEKINPQSGEFPTLEDINIITKELKYTSIEKDDLETRVAVAKNKTQTHAILPFEKIVSEVKYATDLDELQLKLNTFKELPITAILPDIKNVVGFMAKDPSVYSVVFKQKMFSILNYLKKKDPQFRRESPLYQEDLMKTDYLKALNDLKEEYSESDFTISSFEELLDEDYLVDDDTDDEADADDTDDDTDDEAAADEATADEGEGNYLTIEQYLSDNRTILIKNIDSECKKVLGGFNREGYLCEWTYNYNEEDKVEIFTNEYNKQIVSTLNPNVWYIILFNDKNDNFCFLTYDIYKNWIIVDYKLNPTIITQEYLIDYIENYNPIYSYDLKSKVGEIEISYVDYKVLIS